MLKPDKAAQAASGSSDTEVAAARAGTPGKTAANVKISSASSFSRQVSDIEKKFGVKVAQKPKPVKNPYLKSPEEALAIARKAGIITKSGKLANLFK